MTNPRTPAEALRMAAWQAYEEAGCIDKAAARETMHPYHDMLRAESGAWRDVAARLLAEAARLDSAWPPALSEGDRRCLRDVLAFSDEYLTEALKRLDARGWTLVRVREVSDV